MTNTDRQSAEVQPMVLTDEEITRAYIQVSDDQCSGKEWAVGGLRDAAPFARLIEAAVLAKQATQDAARDAERLVEEVAQGIYEHWKIEPGYTPWVPGGNSTNQSEARRLARTALDAYKE